MIKLKYNSLISPNEFMELHNDDQQWLSSEKDNQIYKPHRGKIHHL